MRTSGRGLRVAGKIGLVSLLAAAGVAACSGGDEGGGNTLPVFGVGGSGAAPVGGAGTTGLGGPQAGGGTGGAGSDISQPGVITPGAGGTAPAG
ncbi:MAG: PE family protein, partial [Polyangiaceae bacterium]